jgi:hypothetical protein
MKLKFLIVSVLTLLALSACSPFDNLPTVVTPTGQPAAAPLEAEAAGTPVQPDTVIEPSPAVEVAAEDGPAADAVAPYGPPAGLVGLEGESYDLHVAGTLQFGDLDTLKWMLGERFAFLTWDNDLREVSSEEALERLRREYFMDSAAPVVIFGADVSALLGGADPLAQWGPVANPVRAMHVMGLGPDANQEAVFVIALDSSGYRYVHGMIIPPGGYFKTDPDADRVNPTSVEYVMAKTNLRLRTGPGFEYAQEGLVYEGQIAKVTGLSKDGQWWRVACEVDSSGNCWMSADPDLTEPTSAP